MKFNFLKMKTLALTAALVCLAPQSKADCIEEYLNSVEESFDRATSPTAKFEVVSQLVNVKVLREADSLEEVDRVKLAKGFGPRVGTYTDDEGKDQFNSKKSNPLALAILFGKPDKVEKFLSVVENVNDDIFTAWGYRQPYYPAHVALDPQFPTEVSGVWLGHRLRIIDLLGEKGADFNKLPPAITLGVYQNPPLPLWERSTRRGG